MYTKELKMRYHVISGQWTVGESDDEYRDNGDYELHTIQATYNKQKQLQSVQIADVVLSHPEELQRDFSALALDD